MCLAIPSRVISIENLFAMIDVFGARKKVSLMLMPEETKVGDYVLVHAGFAIQKVDKDIVESGKAMHETALALSILDIVVNKCTEVGRQDRSIPSGSVSARPPGCCRKRCSSHSTRQRRRPSRKRRNSSDRDRACRRRLQRMQKRVLRGRRPVCVLLSALRFKVLRDHERPRDGDRGHGDKLES